MHCSAANSLFASSVFIEKLNLNFFSRWNTRLEGGFEEPLYLPSQCNEPAKIRYTKNYFRSALHETSHWCIAGAERRDLVDYGYWYRPDGRNTMEQREFFQAEVKPQALELAFSKKCKIEFQVSCDNLNHDDKDSEAQSLEFAKLVHAQLLEYEQQGFPPRAQQFLEVLDLLSNESSF